MERSIAEEPSVSQEPLVRRPKRADAARNFDRLLDAARAAFEEDGEVKLEDVARRAGVGIGTLYRNFPTRLDLLQAVYFDEVDGLRRVGAEVESLEPWDALATWLHAFAAYTATKRAVAQELLATADRESPQWQTARRAVTGTGDALVRAGQEAGVVRPDVSFTELGRLVNAAAAIPGQSEAEVARMVDLVLDGVRAR